MIGSQALLTQIKDLLEEYAKKYSCELDRNLEKFYGFDFGTLDVDINFDNADCELRLYPKGQEATFAIYWNSKMSEQHIKEYFELQIKTIKAYFDGKLIQYQRQSKIFGFIEKKSVGFGISFQQHTEDIATGKNLEIESFQQVLPPAENSIKDYFYED